MVSLYDISGKLVWAAKQDWAAGKQTAIVEADIPDGVYMLLLENSDGARLALPAIKEDAKALIMTTQSRAAVRYCRPDLSI